MQTTMTEQASESGKQVRLLLMQSHTSKVDLKTGLETFAHFCNRSMPSRLAVQPACLDAGFAESALVWLLLICWEQWHQTQGVCDTMHRRRRCRSSSMSAWGSLSGWRMRRRSRRPRLLSGARPWRRPLRRPR